MRCPTCRRPMLMDSVQKVWACVPCGKAIEYKVGVDFGQGKDISIVHVPMTENESNFLALWQQVNPDLPLESEYLFNPFRNWRLDFCHIATKTAIEVEGFGHGMSGRYAGDIAKYNALAYDNWTLFRITRKMMRDDGERFCRMVAEAIKKRSV